MNKFYCNTFILSIILVNFTTFSFAQNQLAFPSAEGYGKYTVGGRGGKVFEITNLNNSGEGSLRAAVEAKGPRTVVFRVSGTIDLKSELRIKNPNITIAGQTAPGDGICIKRYPLMISADEVIIRYIRVRLGNEKEGSSDALTARYQKNIILDHVSVSWSGDEVLTVYHCENVTVQWCLVAESIGGSHRFGGIWGSNYSTYHHNLIAHHIGRNPRFASGSGNTDYRNNVVYNWGNSSTYGGEKAQPGKPQFNFSNINVVANYYKPGPATKPGEISHCIVSPWSRNGAEDYGKWFVSENFMYGNDAVSANNWNGGVQTKGGSKFDSGLKLDEPWKSMVINQQSAEEAYHSVLDRVGAILPKRDVVDARIIGEVRNGSATFKNGLIESQSDVGGWPELKGTTPPADTDHDGMPDEWESKHGLNPKDASDRNDVADDGYTMLEKYLNSIG